MTKYYEQCLLIFLILFSFILRVWEFDSWFSTNDPWIYFENAVKVFEGRQNLHMWLFPVGHSLVLALYFALFGVSTNTACVVSAVSGSLSVLVVYLIGREFFGCRTGFISAFIFSLSPIHVYLSSTIMADSTSLFFALLSAYSFIKFKVGGNPLFLYGCAVYTSFAVMARYNYWALIMVYILIECLRFLKSPKNVLRFCLNRRLIVAAVLFLVFFSPQLRYNFYHFGNPFKPGYLDADSDFEGTLSLKNAFTAGYLRPTPTILLLPHLLLFKYTLLPPYLIFFYVIGLSVIFMEKRSFESAFIALWLIVFSGVNLLYLHSIFLTRYSLPLLLPLSLLAGYGVVKATEVLQKKGAVLLIAFVLLYSTTLVFAFWLREDAVKMHELEARTYGWLNSNTEEDSTLFFAQTRVDPFAKEKLERRFFDFYGLNKSFIKKSITGSNNTYFVIVQDENDRTKNGLPLFFEVKDDYKLVKVKEDSLRLSMMSPWRAYTLTVYRVSLPEAGSKEKLS